ncbi:thioredoxin domain-containing protein [Patulibacter sp. SYSU D01012]|uniref:DsbA family protein n=1 Tax=Patulibacter sp. SYSU D01012 TaxID=2817381 RepID=UPI001B30E75E|nr:thioredoxin domain-containing protein [Patulibacter sp. SYSU D01012]
MSSANKKREQAQKARLEREKAEQAARERSQRLKLLGGAVVLVLVIVGVVLAAGVFKDTSGGSKDTKVQVDGNEANVKGVAETNELLKGVPQNGTVLGKPDAPVTIIEFADMKCPACQQYEVTHQNKVVDELVKTGKANLNLQLINIIDPNAGTTDGADARRAALNLVAKNKFFNFVHTSYYNQGLENDTWATEKRLKEIGAGAPGVGAAAINIRETPAVRELQAKADKLSQDLKVSGTPAFYVQPRGTREYTPVQDPINGLTEAVDAAAKKAK